MSRGECFCSGHMVSLAAAQVRANVGVHRRVGRWCPPSSWGWEAVPRVRASVPHPSPTV